MKPLKWLGLLTSVAFPLAQVLAQSPVVTAPMSAGLPQVAGSNVSTPAAEVVRLAAAGTGEDVIVAYVQNSQSPFGLTADNVLYLKDVGVSSTVIAAMLN